ncbi:SAM-dependent methyltransferase [Legionella maceachernii]|uniref:Cyclopropane-fatty-acyl-phospholipid synthase n=1 Tax=Legionella maceachernii TaxID=466 RepID=A0A0W0W4T7_9GAMM|nr:cyclopropane-fatty-acyl-phospholipid synthase family protein [Legionella maceachernii]KTD27203.1 cyclopropane-fatty-acyl-phospholipid synthase [Legionella maceachernii]SKA13038.1 cyclopropane-fatty-acyl-phospholipid synthase [Legionella maceachernii]SUP04731.1 Cyclopropane-fatty-acyl-phospholipid synthase [Legionella maceachernii]
MHRHNYLAPLNSSFFQKIFLKLLNNITDGRIEVCHHENRYAFGCDPGKNDSTATIIINNPIAYRTILLEGSIGAGKSYINGHWDADNLQQLIEIFIKNEHLFSKLEGPLARLISLFRTINYKFKLNSIDRAKENILAHYDLGNNFFKLILDPLMMYSCALYTTPETSLEEASIKKIETICTALRLQPTDHILEIGTGWGGFACYAAQKYGCKITTTTISEEQYIYVKKKINQLGLENQIELLRKDYRKLSGEYDKIVSIEMIEAVGHKYFNTFFNQCNQLLKAGGLFFLQSIVINDQAYEAAKNEVDFIKKYIFPGGCLPSVYSISKSIATQTALQLLWFQDIGNHYVATLNDWHKKLVVNKEEILAQGFTESFIRMWEFYFCYCAAGFHTKYISNIHALWQKRR